VGTPVPGLFNHPSLQDEMRIGKDGLSDMSPGVLPCWIEHDGNVVQLKALHDYLHIFIQMCQITTV